MIDIRPKSGLGRASLGWLEARHHFSFGNYHHPGREGWGRLRVWNDDIFEAQSGFPMHPHRDMEIVTFVRSGSLTHEDSLGNAGRTSTGGFQTMSAGTGLRHAELNLEDKPVSIFQIWIEPDHAGGPPAWAKAEAPPAGKGASWTHLASGRGAPGALPIRADADVLLGRIDGDGELVYETRRARRLYLVLSAGCARINGRQANEGDGVAVRDEARIVIEALGGPVELVMTDTL